MLEVYRYTLTINLIYASFFRLSMGSFPLGLLGQGAQQTGSSAGVYTSLSPRGKRIQPANNGQCQSIGSASVSEPCNLLRQGEHRLEQQTGHVHGTGKQQARLITAKLQLERRWAVDDVDASREVISVKYSLSAAYAEIEHGLGGRYG